jgi:hypothetical protein
VPAKLHRPIQNILGSICARNKLATEANAKYRLVIIAESANEIEEIWEIWELGIRKCILFATKQNKRLMITVIFW